MGKEFIRFLCGGIKAHGVIDTVVYAKGYLLVATVNTGAAGVDEVLNAGVGRRSEV